jgi:hypothetical protein
MSMTCFSTDALCECGCRGRVNPGRRFIYGHQNRGRYLPCVTRAAQLPVVVTVTKYDKRGFLAKAA